MNNNKSSVSPSSSLSPALALEKLLDGNRRFTSGVRSVENLLSHVKMEELAAKGQTPFAIVLTCSDSRSPVEMIFDQGLGDLFVVRVAGNVVAPSLLASIEFAAANFGSPLVMVLGHTKCGAVDATLKHCAHPSEPLPSPHLEELIARIRPAAEHARAVSSDDVLGRATVENIQRSRRLVLEQSQIIRDLHQQKKIAVVGALLDLSSGKVNLVD